VGTHLYGSHDFSEYQIFSQEAISSLKVLKNEENLPWTTWVGAAGMPGQTAWYGLEKISKPVAGETMFVSGAAGAVGH
jgi:NADPH-dependent curcumin reductase CurA